MKVNLDNISETGIILIILLLSGILYKGCNKIIGSNCYEVSCCGFSCKRQPLDNESAIEILNNQGHVNQHTLHEIIIDELKDNNKQLNSIPEEV